MHNSQHPWHGLNYGDKAPEIVTAVIEIPCGSIAKYEIDKDSGLLMLDRVIYGSFQYPTNYGLIPRTYSEDNDPLDILVLSQVDIDPLCLVETRVIGAIKIIDGGEEDDKIIGVAHHDPYYNDVHELSDLPKHKLDKIKHFFENYKTLEKKVVDVREWEDRKTAIAIVEKSIAMYKEKFPT